MLNNNEVSDPITELMQKHYNYVDMSIPYLSCTTAKDKPYVRDQVFQFANRFQYRYLQPIVLSIICTEKPAKIQYITELLRYFLVELEFMVTALNVQTVYRLLYQYGLIKLTENCSDIK